MNQKHYTKTAAGHAEIQQKAQPLSRAARNLLLLINESHTAEHWLTQIRGVTEPDLEHLLTLGLIASTDGPASARAVHKPPPSAAPAPNAVPPHEAHAPLSSAAASAPSAVKPAAVEAPAAPEEDSGDTVPSAFADDDGEDSAAAVWRDLQAAIRSAEYAPLYEALTRHAKSQLGLVKGYKFTLQVEQCADVAALKELARQFSSTLRNERGMAAVEKFRSSLMDAHEPR
jgi:hypothetical protein